jgi:thiol-disulfide isomerase/thioredoxin
MLLTAARRSAVVALAAMVMAACSASGTGDRKAATAKSGVDPVGVTMYPVTDRQLVPDVRGTTLDGKSLSLRAEGEGRVVLLNVWASWCGPCRSESPMLADAAKSLAPSGVQFVGIDEQDQTQDGRSFAASAGMSYPNLIDKEGALLAKLSMLPQMGIPSTLLLDRHGRIAARVIGPISSSQVTTIVDKLLAES